VKSSRERLILCGLCSSVTSNITNFASSLAKENFTECSFKHRIHAGVYEGVNSIGEIKEKHAEEFNVSRHLRHQTATPQNNNNPKRYPTDPKHEDNSKERFTDFNLMSAYACDSVASLDRG